MKKRISFLLAIAFCVLGCGDLDILDEEPKAIATETFLNTKEEIEGTIYSIYFQLQRFECFGRIYELVNEAQADYAVGRGSFAPPSDYTKLDPTNATRVQDTWAIFYRGISFANRIIKVAPEAKSASAEDIKSLVAEARFLRGLCYFYLVRSWGAVPLFHEGNMNDFNQPRTPINEVYNFIVEDLKVAEADLVDSQPIIGRPQKSTAKVVLADVYLAMEKWPEAREKALEVINSNVYALVPVSKPDDFYNIFGPGTNGTTEEVFYIKYSREKGEAFTWMFHSPSFDYANFRGAYGIYTDSVANNFIKDWDPQDLRKSFNLYHADIGFGPTTMLGKKFIDKETVSDANSNDLPLYRYADLLLLYAEADARLNNGPSEDGVEKLNMVHRRAYGYPPTAPSPVDFKAADYHLASFLDLVLRERGYETIFEGKRFVDLKRMGKLREAVRYAKGKEVSEASFLWPIPANELQYNDALDEISDQNPGY